MASLKIRRKKWYARIRYWDGVKQIEKQIPLKTESKLQAYERLKIVEKYEKDIKAGMEIAFPWMNNTGAPQVIQLNLASAFEEFLESKKSDGLRKTTIDRYKYSYQAFIKVVSGGNSVNTITQRHIDRFKQYWGNKHDPTTINIDLSKIGCFLKWCYMRGYIEQKITIVKMQDACHSIEYLSDQEFIKIMQSPSINSFYKRVFLFYRETGCRLAEPFNAELKGKWLIINPGVSKTHRKREIELTLSLLEIYKELVAWAKKPPIRKQKSCLDRISKMFKLACRTEGLNNHHFHNLRDTFAVRLWGATGDIHYVSKVIGHTSVTTTEKYADFNPRRLIDDFPSLKDKIEARLERGQNTIRDTEIRDTLALIEPDIVEKSV